MSPENQQNPSREAPHIRTREEVEAMNNDAEREIWRQKMAERLGPASVEQVVAEPLQAESASDLSERLGDR